MDKNGGSCSLNKWFIIKYFAGWILLFPGCRNEYLDDKSCTFSPAERDKNTFADGDLFLQISRDFISEELVGRNI